MSNNNLKITSDSNLVAIIIPVYIEKLSYANSISLMQLDRILKNHPKILVAPSDLNIAEYLKICSDLKVCRFDKKYFDGFEGYNRLLLSPFFYEYFLNFKYVLIHQLDVFIFKDELNYWCNQNYDYIGAPWFKDSYKIFIKIVRRLSLSSALKLLPLKSINFRAGNGGLSLRNVKSSLECLELQKQLVDSWNLINEDIFWSFYSKKYNGRFNIPDFKTALKFAIEKNPREAFELNDLTLPFGVHAWEKWDEAFWSNHIEQFGFNIGYCKKSK
jgi:hypothetical protein